MRSSICDMGDALHSSAEAVAAHDAAIKAAEGVGLPQDWTAALDHLQRSADLGSRLAHARQTCFCRLLRSATTAAKRSRSPALTSIMIPSRMAHCRTSRGNMESYDCV